VSTLQGSKPGKKHKLNYRQKCEIRDLVDLGDGYDETDPFVDNTEAVCVMLLYLFRGVEYSSCSADELSVGLFCQIRNPAIFRKSGQISSRIWQCI